MNILSLIITEDHQHNLSSAVITNQDKDCQILLAKISSKLNNILKLSDNEFHALCRLRNLCGRIESMNPDYYDFADIRNQIFKIANELNIELPNHFF